MQPATNTPTQSTNEPKRKRHRPSVAAGLWIVKRIERVLMRFSALPDQPWFDAGQFEWTKTLEANAPAIRTELERILDQPERIPNFQDISRDQVNITRDDQWKTFFLHGYGYRMDGNCAACPETARVVESIPGMYTAFFSILSPGKHIPPHRGPYKGLIRGHLALLVPENREDCWIEVGDEIRHWETDRCLVFDDTYRHRVENNTDQRRVVLFLDIKRPMRGFGRVFNNSILRLIRLSPFIRDAIRNHKAWETRLGDGQPGN